MTVLRWIGRLRHHAAPLMLLVMFLLVWQSIRAAAAFEPDRDRAQNRTGESIRRAAAAIIKPGDTLFLTSHDGLLLGDVGELGASVYELDPADADGMEAALRQVMDEHCGHAEGAQPPDAYWIWTAHNGPAPMLLGRAAAALNFFFAFEAILPYSGDDAFAIDKVLRLQPKEPVMERYCEALRVAGDAPVIVILDAGRFSPWIGSVVTGPITWLASGPERKMSTSDFAVNGMPPLVTYDVYWMGQLQGVPSWTFSNQDMAAYEQVVQAGSANGSVVLVDQDARLGATALRYLRDCRPEETSLRSSLFHQMCFQ